MRILWIEDNPKIKLEQQQTWFGEFSQTQQIERVSDFGDAYEKISQKLSRYDLAVLDINLEYSASLELRDFPEISFPEAETDRSKAFLEEAGFHLYLQLLKQGFPRNRVIFLTSNTNPPNNAPSEKKDWAEKLKTANQAGKKEEFQQAVRSIRLMLSGNENVEFNKKEFDQKLSTGTKDQVFAWLDQWIQQGTIVQGVEGETTKNTYEDFATRFEAARLIPPAAYDKKRPECSTNLQNWLQSHCKRTPDNQSDYEYLTLRRGILDVVTDLQLSDAGLTEDFQELDKPTFLTGLEWQLRDLVLPKEDYHNVYFALCDYLTKPFERYHGKDLLQDDSRHYDSRHLKLPLYYLRNLIAHGLILGSNTRLSASAAGVTFLIAMKSLFDVEQYGFKEELKRLFSPEVVTETKLRPQLKSLSGEYGRKDTLKALYKLGQKESNNWQQEDYLRHFYAACLFSVQQEDFSIKDTPWNGFVYHELRKQKLR